MTIVEWIFVVNGGESVENTMANRLSILARLGVLVAPGITVVAQEPVPPEKES